MYINLKMKEEKRELQLTGGSTFTISLPIKWAKEVGVIQGDELSLIQRGDNSLIITPLRDKKERIKEGVRKMRIGVRGQRDSLGYRIIVKSMERIGDHVENIAKNSMMLMTLPVGIKGLEGIKEVGIRVKDLFIKTLASLSDLDIEKANEAIMDANMRTGEIEVINERFLAEKWCFTDKIRALSILGSLGRIAKYCEDISEVTINRGIKVAGELKFFKKT